MESKLDPTTWYSPSGARPRVVDNVVFVSVHVSIHVCIKKLKSISLGTQNKTSRNTPVFHHDGREGFTGKERLPDNSKNCLLNSRSCLVLGSLQTDPWEPTKEEEERHPDTDRVFTQENLQCRYHASQHGKNIIRTRVELNKNAMSFTGGPPDLV